MMTSTQRGVLQLTRKLFRPRPVLNLSVSSTRALTSSADGSGSNDTELDAKKQSTDGFFDQENTADLSPLEVARMRVTYGLVKEHIDAIEKGLPGLDPDSNPLIDPRSFDVRTLPELPPEVLKHFRKEVPPDVASESRSVSTYNLWESIQSGETHELIEEHKETKDSEWAAVDERTMPPDQYSRLQRQSVTSKTRMSTQTPSTAPQPAYFAPKKMKKGDCPLKDERGKANVDYRAVGTLKAFLSDNLKILPRKKSGLSAKSQRKLSKAVKTARTMALLNPEPIPKLTVEEMKEIERHLP